MNSRIMVFFLFFLTLLATLLFRAFMIQVLPNSALSKLQKRQYTTMITLPAQRGNIVDRLGAELATSIAAESLYADPSLIDEPRKTSKKLSPYIGMPASEILAKLTSNKQFVWVKRQLSPEMADAVRALRINGLAFVPESRRAYPNQGLLSQVLGFVGHEGSGLEGVELKYDKELRGEKQAVVSRRDARGRPLLVSGQLFELKPDGADVQLTIDKEIQYELERELLNVLHEQKAAAATGIVLDPKTGELIAVASVPSYDNSEYIHAHPENRKNRAITDVFEPGSTFKAVLAAAALHSGKARPNTKYFCENGKFQVGKRVIREAESRHKWEWLTMAEILQVSSNIGSTKIAFELGQRAFREAIENFGFGRRTGIDVPGEGAGIVVSAPWPDHLMANISFGHGIGVTALQIANAYAAIANGGHLMRPYLVSSVRDHEGKIIEENTPQVVRDVLTKKEASMMTMMLTGVTEEGGTGTLARVDGYPVAGKTGTAQKVDSHGHGYKKGSYVSSFAGFLPANNPQFVIYIVVDDPQKNYYGAQVSAPVFQKVASYALRRRGFMPIVVSEKTLTQQNAPVPVPVVVDAPNVESPGQVPNLKGLTVREVMERLRQSHLSAELIGSGVAVGQAPPAGQKFSERTKVKVFFKGL